jgi:hypothetical protein
MCCRYDEVVSGLVEYLFNECGKTGMCRGKGYTGRDSDASESPNNRIMESDGKELERAGKIATIAAGPASGALRAGLLSISAAADYVELFNERDYIKFGRNYVIDKLSLGWGDELKGLAKTLSGALSEAQKFVWEKFDGISGTAPGFKLLPCKQCLSGGGN